MACGCLTVCFNSLINNTLVSMYEPRLSIPAMKKRRQKKIVYSIFI
jgi:hypothetical protein